MHTTLFKLWETRAKRAKDDKGFTLIELLVVVVILGVLIAIAIPVYLNYRKTANDAAAQSDLRNAVSVMEVCNAQTGAYPLAATATTPPVPCTGQQLNLSDKTVMTYISDATGTFYVVTDTNTGGSNKFFCYNSKNGGSVKATSAALTATTLTTC